ncbi:MAG: hypothetical protein WBI05_15040 [Rhodoferax sp.]
MRKQASVATLVAKLDVGQFSDVTRVLTVRTTGSAAIELVAAL